MGRILRSYRRIAHQEHFCDNCFSRIQPGEEYEATVEVSRLWNGKTTVMVWKRHVEWCEPPPDPEWESDNVEEDLDVDLKKAA